MFMTSYVFMQHGIIVSQIMKRYSSTAMIYQRQMHHHSLQRSPFVC